MSVCCVMTKTATTGARNSLKSRALHRSAHSAGLAPFLVKTPLDASSRQEMHICSLMIDEYDDNKSYL